MSDLEPRRRSRLSRNERVDRGATLVMVSLGAGAVFVVALILSIAGVIGGTIPLLALIVGIVTGFLAYRTVKS